MVQANKKKKRFPSESKKLSKKYVSIVNPTPILPALCTPNKRGLIRSMNTKRLKLTFYNFLRFREERRCVNKLLGANVFVFWAGENSEFPLMIWRGADQYMSASWG